MGIAGEAQESFVDSESPAQKNKEPLSGILYPGQRFHNKREKSMKKFMSPKRCSFCDLYYTGSV